MRLLIDANISARIVAPLRKKGHDVVSVLEYDPNASDDAILARAVREGRTVITYDKDFGELVFREGKPHCGVILLRTQEESFLSCQHLVEQFLGVHAPREIQEHFWTLTDRTTRRARHHG